MKKLSFLILIFFAFTTGMMAQEKNPSISFQPLSYSQALKLSEQSGKLIFVDCYTSWCAPCKWMEQNVFINDSVYTYYNTHFINLKIDMEKGEGVQLKDKFKVASFPTYLFLNESGDIVHRTASRMEASEFLQQGEIANSPALSYSALKKKYDEGDRSNSLLFRYTIVLQKVDQATSQKIEDELISKLSDEDLNSPLGWEIISKLARNENDRLGKYFLQNKSRFESLAGTKAVNSLTNRLGMSTMYQLIREKDKAHFFDRLNEMKSDPDKKVQRNVAMLEMEYYLTVNQPDSFVTVSNRAMHGILEYNDADLSFIARRADYTGKENRIILNQALVLARKAVQLNPQEYSNQGTLASICLDLKLKSEGLIAAGKARELANESTSKIQKLAQELLDKIKSLPDNP